MLKCGLNIVPHGTSILLLPINEISKTIPNGNLTGSLAPARHYLLILVENRNNMQIRKYSMYVGFSLATYMMQYAPIKWFILIVWIVAPVASRLYSSNLNGNLPGSLAPARLWNWKENRGINEQPDWLASQAPYMLLMGV